MVPSSLRTTQTGVGVVLQNGSRSSIACVNFILLVPYSFVDISAQIVPKAKVQLHYTNKELVGKRNYGKLWKKGRKGEKGEGQAESLRRCYSLSTVGGMILRMLVLSFL